jgi:hypothetical protein
VTFYTGPALPVFLLTVFSKGERANLTQGEINALATMTRRMAAGYAAQSARALR